MHSGNVRQTQWLDPFNRDRRCDRWLQEEDMLKWWIIFKKKHYWALFWRISVYRGVSKEEALS